MILSRPVQLSSATFCTLWSTGSDPTVDGVVRIQVLACGPDPSAPRRFDRLCNPFQGDTAVWPSDERLQAEFGLTRSQLESCAPLADVWPEFTHALEAATVIVPDLRAFEAWRAHVRAAGTHVDAPLDAIGLEELEALLLPAGGPLRRRAGGQRRTALEPEGVRALAEEIVSRFQARPPEARALALAGYERARDELDANAPRAARLLRIALALAGDSSEPGSSIDGVADLFPAWQREAERSGLVDTVPVRREEPTQFLEEDLVRLDEIFRTHLPASFASETAGTGGSPHRPLHRPPYRAGQHEAAREIAAALGSGELLLVHAPTGTGKTLSYLVPALLWARRHEVRVGIATYTKALQQQAMDREVPRALAMLAASGVDPLPRVTVLKGRENYLCWRALKLAVPAEDDDGETWLAWTRLVLFALDDPDGDLDRLSLRAPIPLESSAAWRRRANELARLVRCRGGCCQHEEDRRGCAAEVARKRAEQSHLVLTNHAFALARPEFFQHAIFDECEHLHEQAHGAWSHLMPFRHAHGALARLHVPERDASSAVLDRLHRAVLEETPSGRSVARALAVWTEVAGALSGLEAALEGFEAWRDERNRERSERESHSLLREYVESADATSLLEYRREASRQLCELESALAEVAERLDATPLRRQRGLRRSLDLARGEMASLVEALDACLPLQDGRPAFRASHFYDLEVEARGGRALAARVLLPNEILGRNYHPRLSTGIFVSATTWLRGSFGAALGYLGLDRAAEPAPDEDRPPRPVRTFRAPEVFDYSHVLVAVPRDAPPVSDKDTFLDYVRRFVGHLAERTGGRMLVLFTNSDDVRRVGAELSGFLRARNIPLWFQNMESATKEELSDLFRSRVGSVLLGVDTFWFGADFPGETLEHVVIVRLPYGVPDRYHHAQCAALGTSEHWRRIYLPRALAKFRQGFGRLMRRESDRGCVYVLDGRALEPRHRTFLRELPITSGFDEGADEGIEMSARLVRGDTDRCVREALSHMGLLAEVKSRGLAASFRTEPSLARESESSLAPKPRLSLGHEPGSPVAPETGPSMPAKPNLPFGLESGSIIAHDEGPLFASDDEQTAAS